MALGPLIGIVALFCRRAKVRECLIVCISVRGCFKHLLFDLVVQYAAEDAAYSGTDQPQAQAQQQPLPEGITYSRTKASQGTHGTLPTEQAQEDEQSRYQHPGAQRQQDDTLHLLPEGFQLGLDMLIPFVQQLGIGGLDGDLAEA